MKVFQMDEKETKFLRKATTVADTATAPFVFTFKHIIKLYQASFWWSEPFKDDADEVAVEVNSRKLAAISGIGGAGQIRYKKRYMKLATSGCAVADTYIEFKFPYGRKIESGVLSLLWQNNLGTSASVCAEIEFEILKKFVGK